MSAPAFRSRESWDGDDADTRDTLTDGAAARSTSTSIEYAIRLGDGRYVTGWDDYRGEFVPTWTDLVAAQDELDRIKNAGITVVTDPHRESGRRIERDPTLTRAQLVQRQVTTWQQVDQ
ncbi:hypothetical protein LV457_02660 [Mycobacterium sp. MYCO198283]|uniref:hypothetical protein n=1 Tax=Mycobacterium sp. MYCO198283 TaxID=2883505 RepID=UPI001E355362|nr:hypothetical protein [Mycobacterium sp. MYCO198283]MCG5431191.1 hypothetical protein [Mycobacterium sp. MYCO198283]